jgi:hypothetical protein
MDSKDDICYAEAGNRGIAFTGAEPLQDVKMLVAFSNGELRLFDTTLLQGPAFAPLRDEAIFRNPVIFHGVITWDHGRIDIAPETVYLESCAYRSESISE